MTTPTEHPPDGPADLLLYWLTDRGEASARQIGEAGEALRSRAGVPEADADRWRYQLRRGLEWAGHADRVNGRWRINPPALLVMVEADGRVRGYLTGARTRDLRDRLGESCDVRVALPVSPAGGPARWRVAGDAAAVRRLCEGAGVVVAAERGADVLDSLPTLSSVLGTAEPADALFDPDGQGLSSFSVDGGGRAVWRRDREAGAAYLKTTGVRPARHYWVPADGTPPRVLRAGVERSAARWVVLRDHCRLTYGPRRRLKLAGPVRRGDPELIVHRFLRSAAGLPPLRHARGLTFRGIGPGRAAAAARVLELPLRDYPAPEPA